jgi:hypothetical protein
LRAIGAPLVGWIVVTLLLGGPLVLYVMAQWRARREPVADPQLGIKVALHYFALVGFHVALFGAVLLIYSVISSLPSEAKGSAFRSALALVLPGGIVLAVHIAALRRTNDATVPGVKRLVAGYNLFITGIAGVIALILTFQALFERGSSGELGRLAVAMLVGYGGAWVFVGLQLTRDVLGPPPPPGTGLPADATQPQQPTQVGLPVLGGGAFPPIKPDR